VQEIVNMNFSRWDLKSALLCVDPPGVIGPTPIIGPSILPGIPPTGSLSDYNADNMCSYNVKTPAKKTPKPLASEEQNRTMWVKGERHKEQNMEQYLTQAIEWVTSDTTHMVGIVAVIAILGVVNGIRASLNHCTYTRHAGRRVL